MRVIEPTPENIKAARLAAGMLQKDAAAVVHRAPPRGVDRWHEWETGKRPMPMCEWELFLLKTYKRVS